MKTPARPHIVYLMALVSCFACHQPAGNDKPEIQVKYNQLGKVESEISHINGLKHGPAKYYYDNGKLQYLINYEQGKRHGDAYWYYKSGKVYQVTPYLHGKENGIKKKYYESGKIMAEVPYINGVQQPGLKEYKENGTLITSYPEIVFRKPEKTGPDRFFLRFHMSNNTPKVLFTQIVVFPSGDTVTSPVPTKDGVGEIPLYVVRGGYATDTFRIRAEIQTPYKNRYITNGEYVVRISNP